MEREVSQVKLDTYRPPAPGGRPAVRMADCEVKSNWLSNTSACGKDGAFRNALHPEDIEDIAGAYFRQVAERKAVIPAAVIDKRRLCDETTSFLMHRKAYE